MTSLTGVHKYDLTNDGVGYATSGGQVDDIVTQLDEAAGADHRRHGHRSGDHRLISIVTSTAAMTRPRRELPVGAVPFLL